MGGDDEPLVGSLPTEHESLNIRELENFPQRQFILLLLNGDVRTFYNFFYKFEDRRKHTKNIAADRSRVFVHLQSKFTLIICRFYN